MLGIAVAGAAVGQEAEFLIGPEMLGQRFDTLFRSGHDDGPPAALQGLFQDLRQGVFQRLALEMVEADLCHRSDLRGSMAPAQSFCSGLR